VRARKARFELWTEKKKLATETLQKGRGGTNEEQKNKKERINHGKSLQPSRYWFGWLFTSVNNTS
jgi:hypothetical protein